MASGPRKLSAAELEVLSLKPGDRAHLEVELHDHPLPDVTQVRVATKGFSQRFWVPTLLLRAIPRPGFAWRLLARFRRP